MTLEIIRQLIQDLKFTKEEKDSGIVIEAPEKTIERIVSDIKEEQIMQGLTVMSNDYISGEGQDMVINYSFDKLVHPVIGTFSINHSNKFAIYSNINNSQYK